ncbi:MAG TPA: hypothetical protein VHV75_15305 [Solirubrobacteraceae bacterium]|jgi:hypothetical protein|nr:hypothetical protein [Solirubrobacteraceae bacterium]
MDEQSASLAVPAIQTPSAALAQCRESKLLRPVCPRRVPASRKQSRHYVLAGCANAGHLSLASKRCKQPAWSYEVFALPGPQGPTQNVTAWDGKEWFATSYAPLYPPPYFVHVLVQAGVGADSLGLFFGLNFAGNPAVRNPTDVLLNPNRARAVSLGWARWSGHHGELILEPTGGQSGGEVAGHLIFLFASGGVEYAITVHAWVPKVRETSRGKTHLIQAPQPGPALPHVISTLKTIVGSAVGP